MLYYAISTKVILDACALFFKESDGKTLQAYLVFLPSVKIGRMTGFFYRKVK